MQKLIRAISASLDLHNVAPQDRGAMTQLMVGEAVGAHLQVPSSPVEEPVSYFRLHLREEAINVASCVNERLVIDIDGVVELAYKLWITRYRLVHEATCGASKRLLQAVVAEGGCNIPPPVSEAFKRYPNVQVGWALKEGL